MALITVQVQAAFQLNVCLRVYSIWWNLSNEVCQKVDTTQSGRFIAQFTPHQSQCLKWSFGGLQQRGLGDWNGIQEQSPGSESGDKVAQKQKQFANTVYRYW